MGEVLEESARIALSWIRAHGGQLPLLPADACGDNPTVQHPEAGSQGHSSDGPGAGAEGMRAAGTPLSGFQSAASGPSCWDVHVHLPAGAVPKVSASSRVNHLP